MCIICIDYQKKLITGAEAWRNLGEVVIDPLHRLEVALMLETDKLKKLKRMKALPTKRND